MKLGELYTKPLSEVLTEMDLADLKVHTDDAGTVKAIELKYVEKAKDKKGEVPSFIF